MSPAYSICRSEMSSAARRRISRRCSQPAWNHAGCAAPRGGDGVLDVLPGALRERPEEDVGVDRRADLERALAVALLAVDVVAVALAQPGLRSLEPGLVGDLEVLVVGAEGGVGDLETRLRLGRHRSGTSGQFGRWRRPARAPRDVGASLAGAADGWPRRNGRCAGARSGRGPVEGPGWRRLRRAVILSA